MASHVPMPRVAFVYDHLFPHSVGGAENYYWRLATRLSRDAAVTILTRRLWTGPPRCEREGVEIVGLMRPRRLFAGGRRSVRPTILFALALAGHLLRHGRRYDVVHCAGFPQLAVIGAWLGLLPHPSPLVADWHEVWSREYWREYLGRLGTVGWLVQRLAIRLADASVTFSRMHRDRLRSEGARDVSVFPEFPTAPVEAAPGRPRERTVLFAGRLIREKRAPLLAAVISELRSGGDEWRAEIFGRGPDEASLRAEIARHGVGDAVALRGFAPWSEVSEAMARASVLALPTRREGFGIVVLEAAAHGLPTVLIAGPDNAATELVEDGVNGAIVPGPEPGLIAAAVRRLESDAGVHARTREWFDGAAHRLSVDAAADAHRALHARLRRYPHAAAGLWGRIWN